MEWYHVQNAAENGFRDGDVQSSYSYRIQESLPCTCGLKYEYFGLKDRELIRFLPDPTPEDSYTNEQAK